VISRNPMFQSQLESISKLRRTIDETINETINETDEETSLNSSNFNGVMESKQSFKPKIMPKDFPDEMAREDRIKCKPPQYGVPFSKGKDSVIDSLEFSQDGGDQGKDFLLMKIDLNTYKGSENLDFDLNQEGDTMCLKFTIENFLNFEFEDCESYNNKFRIKCNMNLYTGVECNKDVSMDLVYDS
jgi:hypothetical protein